MEFRINKNAELPIYQQLKEQIRYFLLNGALQPGTRVPPPKDLGAYLQINKNTVIAAYKELEQEGFLVTRQGQGTYVSETLPVHREPDRSRELIQLAAEAIAKVKELGFQPADLYTVILNQTLLERENHPGAAVSKRQSPQVLFVECNTPDLRSFTETLQQELGIQVNGCLLDELPDKLDTLAVRQADLVITVFSHLEDVKAILEPLGKEIIALMAAPQFRVLLEISALPPRSKVALVCVYEFGAAKMRSILEAAGIRHLQLQPGSLENRSRLEQLLREADQIICSRAAYREVMAILPPDRQMMKFFAEIDHAGLEMLKGRLAAWRGE